MSDNIIDIAHQLFTNDVQPPNSIQLQFDHDLENGVDQEEVISKMLLTILTEGLKLKFGDFNGKVDLTKLTANNFNTIGEYIKSIGYEPIFYIYTEGNEPVTMNHSKYVCKINPKGTDKIYSISFKPLIS